MEPDEVAEPLIFVAVVVTLHTVYHKNLFLSKWSKLIYTIYEMEIEDRLKFEEGVKRAS